MTIGNRVAILREKFAQSIGGIPTNQKTKLIMPKIRQGYKPAFKYADQYITNFPGRGKDRFKPQYNKDGILVKDYGLIVRACNPFDKNKRNPNRLICLIGTTTFGTEAATNLLCDRENESNLSEFLYSISLISTDINSRVSRSTNHKIINTVEITEIDR